jgi:NAD+ synthase
LSSVSLRDIVRIDYQEVIKSIGVYVEGFVEESGVDKFVLGLSGGVDSTTLLYLLSRLVERDKIIGLIMPDTRTTPIEDVEDAVRVAKNLGVKYYVVPIDTIVDSYGVAPFYDPLEKLATGNLRARVRANLLYYYANKHGALVVGSSDRSELLIGYFTKYGDGAADLYPLSSLYKTQVRELAKYLGVPEEIIRKPSAPRLWKNHTAEGELGLNYETIDLALYALFDLNLSIEEAAEATGLPVEVIDRVLKMHRSTRHKRIGLKTPVLPWLPQAIKEI